MNADLDGEDSRWLIVEDGFTAALANTYETLFTTGNGYLGPPATDTLARGAPWRRAMRVRCRGPSCAVSSITTTPRSPTWSRHPTG